MRVLDSAAVERLLDNVVGAAFKTTPPEIAYHYTDWDGAVGILKNQEFWATAHDCTNDPAEIITADNTILEVAAAMRRQADDGVAELLALFIEKYSQLQIARMTAIYLSCFSLSRDDRGQWCKYGNNGAGICLGVRVLNEAGPPSPHKGVGSFLINVEYSEAVWRDRVVESFRAVCEVLHRDDVPFTQDNVLQGLSALSRISAMQSIRAKGHEWASEQELRHITIAHPDANLPIRNRQLRGETIRYLPVVVRADSKRIALAELLIGPNQDPDAAGKRMLQLLDDAGYKAGDFEYPATIAQSVVPRVHSGAWSGHVNGCADLIRALYSVVAELEARFPGRPFTPDGHLVGSIGEVLAESRYALKLLPCSTALHDAVAFDGRYVQIKATQGSRVAFYGKPDHLIVLKLARDGSADEIYNGPGGIVGGHVSGVAKNGQCSIAVSKLRMLMSQVPSNQRIPVAGAR